MHRTLLTLIGTACLAALAALAGCSKPAQDPREAAIPPVVPPIVVPPVVPPDVVPPGVVPVDDPRDKVFDDIVTGVVPTNQDRYDAALLEALDHLADRHYNQALVALQTAQQAQDTELVRREIAKVSGLIDQLAAAEKTKNDVQTVLDDGKPDDAARLGNDALKQFGGGGDIADELAQQKRQADTLVAAALPNDDERFNRFRTEGDDARTAANLRAAALAYEQALRFREDADVRQKYTAVQTALTSYDDNLRRAARLRRDPSALEDALAALALAQQAWDTPQIRQEIEEYTFALQRRRDRLSVAEFEVRGDVGLPGTGRTVAEELLPYFKQRFDLVERDQVGRVLDELKLEANDLVASPEGQREVGRLARIRYLVVGSITPMNGVTAHARLVNVQTGVVEQTARISAPNIDILMRRLRVLSRLLQMTDDQKREFEVRLDEQAPPPPVQQIQPINLDQPVFAPPPAVFNVNVAPPPPILIYAAAPQNFFVGVEIDFFSRQPLVVFDAPPPPPLAIEVVLGRQNPRRGRLLALSVELGDDLFRRGRYREAQRHFSLALTLSDGHADIALRLDRCRPFLPPPPPPPVFVVAPPPVLVTILPRPVVMFQPELPVVVIPPPVPVRPRLIVFTFQLATQPGLVPPNLGDAASDQFASYFGSSFDIIERGEVCWYMGRLGITFADIVTDPGARIALAQAMNAQFYCFGTVIQTNSLDVEAHLMNLTTNQRTATGKIHVQDHEEMKLRLGELAAQLGAPGAKASQALAQKGADSEKALNDARGLLKANKPTDAAIVARKGLEAAPNSAALRTVLAQAEQQEKQTQLEAQLKAAETARLQNEAALKAQRDTLAKAAETARLKAEAEAKNRTEAAVTAEKARKLAAAQQLQAQGKKALDAGNFVAAVGAYKSAVALNPSPDLYQQLGQSQAKLDESEHKKVADEAVKKADAANTARVAALAAVKKEQESRAADDKVKQDARANQSASLVATARDELKKKDLPKARAAAQSANDLAHSSETEKLLAEIRQEEQLAAIKNDAARQAAEKKIADEKARQDRYQQQLKQAGDAVQAKKYDDAIAHFKEAQTLFSTDVVLTGLKQAEDLKVRAKADADKDQLARAAEEKRTAEVKRLLGEGRKAVDAQKFDEALKAYNDALKVSPGNAEVFAARSQAERARDDYAVKNRAKLEDEQRQAAAKKEQHAALLQQARSAMTARKYDDATRLLASANQLFPDNPTAKALTIDVARARDQEAAVERVRVLLAGARKAIASKDFVNAEKNLAEAARLAPSDPDVSSVRTELARAKPKPLDPLVKTNFDIAMFAAKAAMKRSDYAGAIDAATVALSLIPNDPNATALLKDAQAGKNDTDAKHKADYAAAIQAGRAALVAKKFDDAIKSANDALKLFPGDQAALALVKDAQAGKTGSDADAKKREEFQHLLTTAQQALAAKSYAAAAKAADDALKLIPNDQTATRVLKDANDGIKAEADKKRLADYAAWMQNARTALAAKKYDDVLKSAGEALKIVPGDKDAQVLIQTAQAAKAGSDADKKKQADYAAFIQTGRIALAAKKYDEAIKDAQDALKLFPGDLAATALLKDAQVGKLGADADKKKQADYIAFIQAGRAALAAKKYDDAIKDAQDALKLFPGAPEALALVKDAQTGKAGVDAVAAMRKAEYNRQMALAQQAMTAKRYPDAERAYTEALRQVPNDPAATKGLADAKTADKPPLPMVPDYAKSMQSAQALDGQKMWVAAAAAYRDALKAKPGDPKATFGLDLADGQRLLEAKSFAAAQKLFEDALRLMPNDPTATALLKRAKDMR